MRTVVWFIRISSKMISLFNIIGCENCGGRAERVATVLAVARNSKSVNVKNKT